MIEGNGQDAYGAVIADLEEKIEKMQATVEQLKSLRGQGASSTITASGSGTPTFGHDSFFNMSVTEGARKYLAAIKKTATAGDITDALVRGGWKTTSKKPVETVRVTLGREADFAKINGQFGLAEWYPGRRGAKGKKDAVSLNPKTFEEDPDEDAAYESRRDQNDPS